MIQKSCAPTERSPLTEGNDLFPSFRNNSKNRCSGAEPRQSSVELFTHGATSFPGANSQDLKW